MRSLIALAALLASGALAESWQWQLDSELAYSPEAVESVSKAEMRLRGDWAMALSDDVALTLMPELRWDAADRLRRRDQRPVSDGALNGAVWQNRHAELRVREAYLDVNLSSLEVRLGKQQVVWGQADGLRLLDVINPQQLREFNLPTFEDSRIATWMINAELPLGDDGRLQWLVIPDITVNEQADAGTEFAISSPELRPTLPQGQPVRAQPLRRPDRSDVEIGLRYSHFVGGWDLSANYFHFYHDNPVLYRRQQQGEIVLQPRLERGELLGGSASTAMGNWVLRAEAVYQQRVYLLRDDLQDGGVTVSGELKALLGLDYYGWRDSHLSYQLFYSRLSDTDRAVVRRRNSLRHTLSIKRFFYNDTVELQVFALLNVDHRDGELRTKLSYQFSDQWRWWLGVDHFFGRRSGPFGQFHDARRAVVGWQYAF